ncbi:MAG: glycoside hydrolase family 5 protein [Ruminococcaceae bacterium]|nr:glycoside hydrolase family 5 protein [Oscillospiraceae bacterium]
MKTKLMIDGRRFCLNGVPVYQELPDCPPQYHGLLMNARFIQGVFDDRENPRQFDRFGLTFDAEENTDALIAALPQWYESGLRAITVGFQGGGPCFTMENTGIANSPFSPDGGRIDPAYLARMERIIAAADEIGMVVIVSLFYGAQCRFFRDDAAIRRAVETACAWLKALSPTNVILEIANEFEFFVFDDYPILQNAESMAALITFAKAASGGLPVGCSGSGGYFSQVVAEASDVILVHGNSQSRQQFAALLKKALAVRPARPVLCNEDSPSLMAMEVALRHGVSWGYYNNLTKQEPPTRWGILPGMDACFAARMRERLGIPGGDVPEYAFTGLAPHETVQGKRWIGIAALHPERIDRVEFTRNGSLYDICYLDPFTVHFMENWRQGAVEDCRPGEVWRADIFLTDGSVVSLEERIPEDVR